MLKQRSWQTKHTLCPTDRAITFWQALQWLCSCPSSRAKTINLHLAVPLLSRCPCPPQHARASTKRAKPIYTRRARTALGHFRACNDDQQIHPGSRTRTCSSQYRTYSDEQGSVPASERQGSENCLRERTPIGRLAWSQIVNNYLGSLPIRNYANDFEMWEMSVEDIWSRYQLLPEPRCQAVSRTALRFILGALGRVKPRTRSMLMRYQSVIDEMMAQNPPLVPLKEEWTTLISFHGRVHRKPTSADVEKCMALWHEMESTYGIKANRVTFNVLLDVSAKAREWQSLDLILQEMQSREIDYDRYTWTTLIYAAGLRKDAFTLRRLAKPMLARGEVLDTVIMNAIISALLRCEEYQEAEDIFASMKRLTEPDKTQHTATPTALKLRLRPSSTFVASQYQHRARVNQERINAGNELTGKDISPGPGDDSYPTPDIGTYNMILNHRCTKVGDFAAVSDLLEEMHTANMPDTETMFESLFTGFSLHGKTNSDWDLPRLQYVFDTFLAAQGLRVSQTLALKALQAFAVVGDRKQIMFCYESLDRAWLEQGGDPSKRSTNVSDTYAAALSHHPKKRDFVVMPKRDNDVKGLKEAGILKGAVK